MECEFRCSDSTNSAHEKCAFFELKILLFSLFNISILFWIEAFLSDKLIWNCQRTIVIRIYLCFMATAFIILGNSYKQMQKTEIEWFFYSVALQRVELINIQQFHTPHLKQFKWLKIKSMISHEFSFALFILFHTI